MKDLTIICCSLDFNLIDYKIALSLYNLGAFYKIILVSPKGANLKIENAIYLIDDKKGLSYARDKALELVNTKYVMILGDDNIIYKPEIEKAIEYMNNNSWVGCGFLTRTLNPKGYLQKALDYRWEKRFKSGQCEVVGSPMIYKTSILKEFYDKKSYYSDDTLLADKLKENGYKQGFSDSKCYELGFSLKQIIARYKIYGKSDKKYWNENYKAWGLKRRLQSLLHPLTCEWLSNLWYMPFYILIVFYRYLGWIKK